MTTGKKLGLRIIELRTKLEIEPRAVADAINLDFPTYQKVEAGDAEQLNWRQAEKLRLLLKDEEREIMGLWLSAILQVEKRKEYKGYIPR